MINRPVNYNPANRASGLNNVTRCSFQGKNSKDKDPKIFISMPMGKDSPSRARWNRLNEAIKTTAEPIGFVAERIDDILLENAKSTENQFILQNILDKIDGSNMVIADVSERNPNVYFEMGYALGKGKKILPVAKEGTDLPFDVKDINTVFYRNTGQHLKNRLGSILSSIYKNDKKEKSINL